MSQAPAAGFPHRWEATVLAGRPLILPRRRYVYPREAEEVERGALELLVKAGDGAEPFLATCALGFADPLAPTGVWSSPAPDELCAVAGGYAYLIDTCNPSRWQQVPYRPVLRVVSCAEPALLLFVGSRSVLAHGAQGRAWESPRLSDEGVTVGSIAGGLLHGKGWDLRSDREVPFVLDLRTGAPLAPPA